MVLDQLQLKNQYGEQSLNQVVPAPDGAAFIFPSGAKLYSGSGAPSVSAPAGSMYLRIDGSASTCLYINPTVGNNWAAVTVP